MPGNKIEVDGLSIHYEKVGNGDHPVLLLPGALGSTQSDFKPQLESLDRNKLTIVAWDPPGYGYSRPPNRKIHMDIFRNDALIAKQFMNKLNFKEFSIVGWSDGGITSLILSAHFPKAVKKMVVFGSNSYISEGDLELYAAVRDISKWSKRMRVPMIAMYGEDYFKNTWERWCDLCEELFHKRDGNICRELLKDIVCPTLIIHGQNDNMLSEEHPKYLNQHIQNSKLKYYPEGKHNLHLKYWKEFNNDVEDFLLS